MSICTGASIKARLLIDQGCSKGVDMDAIDEEVCFSKFHFLRLGFDSAASFGGLFQRHTGRTHGHEHVFTPRTPGKPYAVSPIVLPSRESG
jgi:hypothetical protein